MLNKICGGTFVFKTVNAYESSNAAGWKAAQVEGLSIGMWNPSFLSIFTGNSATVKNFNIEVGLPANFPDHVAKAAATYAVNKAGSYMVGKGYQWFSETVYGGTFNSIFKALATLYLNAYLGLPKNVALVNTSFVSKGVTPSIPVICTEE